MDWLLGGVAGAGKGLVATAVREVVRVAGSFVGSELVRKLAGSTPITAIIFAVVEQVWLTWRYRRGKIGLRRYFLGTVRNAGSTAGSVLGAVVMAIFLSVVPVLGTFVGLLIGSFLGSLIVGYGARTAVALAWKPEDEVSPVRAGIEQVSSAG